MRQMGEILSSIGGIEAMLMASPGLPMGAALLQWLMIKRCRYGERVECPFSALRCFVSYCSITLL
jgi:hypothetical protein